MELQESFERFISLPQDAEANEVIKAGLEMFYYWVNFTPITRGAAFVGYTLLYSIVLSRGYVITSRVPKNRQLDWEAILYTSPDEFISHQSWLKVQTLSSDTVHDLGTDENNLTMAMLDGFLREYDMDTLFSTPREILTSLNNGVSEEHKRRVLEQHAS